MASEITSHDIREELIVLINKILETGAPLTQLDLAYFSLEE